MNNCKLGGILTETKTYQNPESKQQELFLITGVGINILDTRRYLKESIIEAPKAAPISLQEFIPEQYFKALSVESLIDRIADKLGVVPPLSTSEN